MKTKLARGFAALLYIFFYVLFGVFFSGCSTTRSWEPILAENEIGSCSLGFGETSFGNGVDVTKELPYFKSYHRRPLSVPYKVRALRSDLIERADSLENLTEYAATRANIGSRHSIDDPESKPTRNLAAKPDGLLKAIQNIHRDFGKTLGSAETAKLKSRLDRLPRSLQEKFAGVLEAARLSSLITRNELKKLGGKKQVAEAFKLLRWDCEAAKGDAPADISAVEAALATLDRKKMLARNLDLLAFLDDAIADLKKERIPENASFDWETPIGWISLHGSDRNDYRDGKHYLFLVDHEGDDTYANAGNAFGPEYPVSIVIDTKGNDRYLVHRDLENLTVAEWKDRTGNTIPPAFGVGIFGVGVLVDLEGNDVYRAGSDSIGRGMLGVGIVYDGKGNDVYDCYGQCEGSADLGIGILVDREGSDHYDSFISSQGYGGPYGFGLLLDTGKEDDHYTANDTVWDLPLKRQVAHNVSLAQGAGVGWRRDYVDGHSIPGGIGVLVDEGGNNRYHAGVYAQGFGFWEGLGVLSSGDGNDEYVADYYGQGSAAHFAVGILHDTGGDDHYFTREYQSMGHGRDWSLGFLLDEGGNDTYDAPAYSLGSGDLHGIGIFWDRGGDDHYESKSPDVLGTARVEGIEKVGLHSNEPTVGVFIDSAGRDTYSTPRKDAGNGSTWKQRIPTPNPSLYGGRGIGADFENPSFQDPSWTLKCGRSD